MLPMPQIILSAVSVSPTLIWCIIGIAVFLLLYMACGYVKAPPNKAYIVSGLRKKKKILIGRAGFRMPLIERIDKLSLDVMQVDVKTSEAVPTQRVHQRDRGRRCQHQDILQPGTAGKGCRGAARHGQTTADLPCNAGAGRQYA